MKRIALVAGLASTIALSLGAVSAQAAPFAPGFQHGHGRVVQVVRWHRPYFYHHIFRSHRHWR